MTQRLCQKGACGAPATHALQLACPGFLDPDEAPPRATILIGVLLCEACLDDETAERWFEANPALRQVFTVTMAGGPDPDFERAVVLGVSLNSPEYQHLLLEGLKQPRSN
jgi:hypothetical protein